MKLSRAFIAVSAITFAFLSAANGSVITSQFTGTVAQVPIDEVFGDIDFGDAIQGTFSYDTSAADLIPGDPATGSYAFTAPFGMSVTIGTHTFNTSGSLNIGIVNSFIDQFTVLATSSTGDVTLELFLQDNTGRAFSDDHLPSSALSLDGFTQREFHLDGIFGGSEVQVDGSVGAVTIATAPEPASQAGIVAALVVLLALKRRRGRISKNIH